MNKFNFKASIVGVPHQVKQRWHANARAKLRKLAEALGLEPDTYNLRSNHGGVAVSGESILHGEHVYIQVSQSILGYETSILYRRCKGRKDYVGECNHFVRLDALHDIESLAAVIERDLGPCYKPNANEVPLC